MNENWPRHFWKYATAVVVALSILNPEMVQLALFVDAVGLEVLLMLIEVQVLAVLGIFFSKNAKPVLAYLRIFCSRCIRIFTWHSIAQQPERFILVVPSQASLMHMLVFIAAIGIGSDVFQ